MPKIKLLHRTETYQHEVTSGTTLLEVIQNLEIPGFSAPCGGKGTCGKCKVTILEGTPPEITDQERDLLSPAELSGGIRLACKCEITESNVGDIAESDTLVISIPDESGSRIKESSAIVQETTSPRFTRAIVTLPSGSLDNQDSNFTRILKAAGDLGKSPVKAIHPRDLIRLGKSDLDRKSYASDNIGDSSYSLLLDRGNICSISPADSPVAQYGAAIDIGTTTVVIHLIDLELQTIVGTWSALNEQKKYGADVISRIHFSMEKAGNAEKLKKAITGQINFGVKLLLEENTINPDQLRVITITGNTTMLHLLIGCDASGIAAAPFIPIFTEAIALTGHEAGLPSVPSVKVELLPSIAAYVGADITAGISVTKLITMKKPSLLLDIGTNGEMALGDNGKAVCCSTAAGPAFEGANIQFGTGGITGAVDSISIKAGNLEYSTIGGAPAIGICGSGIIDAAAVLIKSGAADYTGRILSADNSGFPWITEFEGKPAMLIANSDETRNGQPIYFTQKDLREVQLAKAAVAGGIRTLVADRGISLEDIDAVFLAGGFGSYIDPENAGIIGLLPGNLAQRTITAGNTACGGAVKALLDENEFDNLAAVKLDCSYIELSARKEFQGFYIEEMYFRE